MSEKRTTSINLNIGSSVDERFKELMNSIPDELKQIQGLKELDSFNLSGNYFNSHSVADASIDPNANVEGKSPVSYQSEIFKPQLKYLGYYELWERLVDKYGIETADDCIRSCMDGSLYYHDATKNCVPYCFAFDTSFLMTEGRPYGWLPSAAPKRSSSFMSQVIETTMDMSQNHAGAIGIANLLVNLAYYTRKERKELHQSIKSIVLNNQDSEDKAYLIIKEAITLYLSGMGMDYDVMADYLATNKTPTTTHEYYGMVDAVYDKYVQNLLQNFVHIMHNTFRIGGDSPFTNLSLFDEETFNTVFEDPFYPDYTPVAENYREVNRLQHIFVEFFHVGSPTNGKTYRFPVVTANIKVEDNGEIKDQAFFNYIIEKNRVRGAFNIHQGTKIASCCRLTSDLSKLKDNIRIDSFGNGGLSIGSHRVVTVNLHRMSMISKVMSEPITDIINHYMAKAEKLLVVHKELLREKVDQGFLNFFNIGWQDLNMFFSTFGYTGLIDAFSVLTSKTLEDVLEKESSIDDYVSFATEVIDGMEDYCTKASKRNAYNKMAFNVEEIPGESAAPKLAKADNFYYKNVDGYQPLELLSNQMIPLYCNVPLMKRLEVSGRLMNKVSGGSILHINLTEAVTPKAYSDLCKLIIEKFNIPHFAINVGSSTCDNGHTNVGILKICPDCGKEITDWAIRVVGFSTDVKSWSKERREEFKHRQFYGANDVTAKSIL